MKQNIARALCLSLVLLCIPGLGRLFADENTVTLESVVIQNFDDPDANPWYVTGSKFSTEGFPKLAYIKAWPQAVYGSNSDNKDLKALGVAMLFDRKGYNWVDIVPGKKDGEGKDTKFSPVELPLPGRVKMIDMWVWSPNFDYYMEAYVRDYKGIVHTIAMGDLSFIGWKNLRINIPDNIPQSKRTLPRKESLSLVKFRIWTKPTEATINFSTDAKATNDDKAIRIYFDNIKVLTDTFETLFDGDSLADPNNQAVKDAWGTGSSGEKK